MIKLTESAMVEIMATNICRIRALAVTAKHVVESADVSVYSREVAEQLAVIQVLADEAESLRSEWQVQSEKNSGEVDND